MMLTTTGVSLRSLQSYDLFDAAYALMLRASLYTEEERKVIDSIDGRLADSSYEEVSGMPAITQWVQPANAADLPAHVRPEAPEGVISHG